MASMRAITVDDGGDPSDEIERVLFWLGMEDWDRLFCSAGLPVARTRWV